MKALTNPEQMAANGKAHLNTLLSFADSAVTMTECLASLNLNFACAMVEEYMVSIRAMVDAKNPQELVALQSGLARPVVERSVAYARGVSEILAEGHKDVTRRLDARMTELNKNLAIEMDYVSRSAPAGSGALLQSITSAIAAGNSAFETVIGTARQLASAAEIRLPLAATEKVLLAEKQV